MSLARGLSPARSPLAIVEAAREVLGRTFRLRELASLVAETAVHVAGGGRALVVRFGVAGDLEVVSGSPTADTPPPGTRFAESAPPWLRERATVVPFDARGERWGKVVILPVECDATLREEATLALEALARALGERVSQVSLDLRDEKTAQARDIGRRMRAEADLDPRDLAGVIHRYDNALRACFAADGIALASPSGSYSSGCLTLAHGFLASIAVRAPHGLLVTDDVTAALPGASFDRTTGLAAIDVDGHGGAWLMIGRVAPPGAGGKSEGFGSWVVATAEALRSELLAGRPDDEVARPTEPSSELFAADLAALDRALAESARGR